MVASTPKSANEFIEHQLDQYMQELEDELKSDVLSVNGLLSFGVDDIIRNAIEEKRQRSQDRKQLAVILTTIGGYIEVVRRIVYTLRHNYRIADFIVPNYAFSAGTILVMSGNDIYMDYYSCLGPIDPQVETQSGQRVPALGYLIQWERLLKKADEGKLTMAEMGLMVNGFDQAELYKYEQERELSIALLEEWLVKYKFKNWKKTETRQIKVTNAMRKKRASTIAKELNKTERWHTHGIGIPMEVLRKDKNLKLLILDFGENSRLCGIIKTYNSLLDDYMMKRAHKGVIHTIGSYIPYM